MTGASSNLRPGLLPPIDDPKEIDTNDWKDMHALGNLQRQVNANRKAAGLPEMTDYDYRRTEMQSLESFLEDMKLA